MNPHLIRIGNRIINLAHVTHINLAHRSYTDAPVVEVWFSSGESSWFQGEWYEQAQAIFSSLVDNHPELDPQLDEMERQAEDWGKTVDYLLAHAPDPEPDYEVPEPPEDYDDEDKPHYDTPLGL